MISVRFGLRETQQYVVRPQRCLSVELVSWQTSYSATGPRDWEQARGIVRTNVPMRRTLSLMRDFEEQSVKAKGKRYSKRL